MIKRWIWYDEMLVWFVCLQLTAYPPCVKGYKDLQRLQFEDAEWEIDFTSAPPSFHLHSRRRLERAHPGEHHYRSLLLGTKKDQKRFNSYVQTRSGPSNVWPFFREKIGQNADQLSLMQRPEWLRFLHAINLFFANHKHRSLGTTPISASIRWRLWIFFCFFRTWTDVMLWNGWVGAKLWSMQVRLAEP